MENLSDSPVQLSEDALLTAACRYAEGRLPDGVVAMSRLCLLDWVGCAVAAAGRPEIRRLRGLILGTNWCGGAGLASALEEGSPADVATMNGIAGHVLDFDDNHFGSETHPGAALWPALLAGAEPEHLPLDRLLRGFACGVEALGALGRMMNPQHYGRAWHATGTLGTVGAAAAVGAMFQLERIEMREAISFAAVQMSGMQASFGSIAKPLNAGRAAAAGLLSARLARIGVPAPGAVFQGRGGVFALMGAEDAGPQPAREQPEVLDIVFKRFPSCFSTHAAIEAALTLRSSPGFSVEAVRSLRITLSEYALPQVGITNPRTASEARFSVVFCVANALVRGDVGIEHCDAPQLCGPEIRRLSELAMVASSPELGNFEAVLLITFEEGDEAESRIHLDPRDTTRVSPADTRHKFRTLSQAALGSARTDALEAAIMSPSSSVADLMSAARP